MSKVGSTAPRLLVLPGDGIGREVVEVTEGFIRALLPSAVIETAPVGYGYWQQCGRSIDEETIDLAKSCDGILFGATATPSPPPPTYSSPILTLRRRMGLFANLRYCRKPGGGIDVVMLRECSEGLYAGIEEAMEGGYRAIHQVTEAKTRRLARVAAEVARKRRGDVTIVHKANVLRHTEGLFRQVCIDVLEEEGVAWNEVLSDAAGYYLVRDPGRFDVMAMPSHTGDLLSDVGAGVAGSLGYVPSLAIGDATPLAEPIHGSAPDIAGKGLADPTACLLSASLLLDRIGCGAAAKTLADAVEAYLIERDPAAGVTTRGVADAVMAHIKRPECVS